MRDYSYRPSSYAPKGDYPASALMGVELEVGGDQGVIADVVEGFDDSESHLYMKEDGSITGVEIVTHPMTLEWARGFSFTALLDELSGAGCYVDSGYGLHVHVSRNAFRYTGGRNLGRRSNAHTMRWLMFVYRNIDKLEMIGRRQSAQWARATKPVAGELAEKAKGGCGRERYLAVNCLNVRTFEVRSFGSTLDPVEFWAALEFIDATVRFTGAIDSRDVLRGYGLGWAYFLAWVNADGNYPNLLAMLGR